jgi:hypothetical protein
MCIDVEPGPKGAGNDLSFGWIKKSTPDRGLRLPIRRERGWWGLPHAGRRSCRTRERGWWGLPHAGRRSCRTRERGWWGLPHAGRRSCRTKAQCTALRHPLPGECGNASGVPNRPIDESPGFTCSFLGSTIGEHHVRSTVADVARCGGHCHADAADRENSSRTHAKQSKRCHSVPQSSGIQTY